jgi:hypothetical protein
MRVCKDACKSYHAEKRGHKDKKMNFHKETQPSLPWDSKETASDDCSVHHPTSGEVSGKRSLQKVRESLPKKPL